MNHLALSKACEVEDFARLNLVAMDDAIVTGSAAMDVAHLLSELMENATSFSPPETHVEILGHQNADGDFALHSGELARVARVLSEEECLA